MTQPETPSWSGAVQRELDGLQRNVETRLTDFSSRLDKLLTLIEYDADKRSLELRFSTVNDKLEDGEDDLLALKAELREALQGLRQDITAERVRYEAAINRETTARETQHKSYIASRQDQFRWLLSMVMIPIAIALVQLVASKK
jgi:hypothetical protein